MSYAVGPALFEQPFPRWRSVLFVNNGRYSSNWLLCIHLEISTILYVTGKYSQLIHFILEALLPSRTTKSWNKAFSPSLGLYSWDEAFSRVLGKPFVKTSFQGKWYSWDTTFCQVLYKSYWNNFCNWLLCIHLDIFIILYVIAKLFPQFFFE